MIQKRGMLRSMKTKYNSFEQENHDGGSVLKKQLYFQENVTGCNN